MPANDLAHVYLDDIHGLAMPDEWPLIWRGEGKMMRVVGAHCDRHGSIDIKVQIGNDDEPFPLRGTYVTDRAVAVLGADPTMRCPAPRSNEVMLPCGERLRIARY